MFILFQAVTGAYSSVQKVEDIEIVRVMQKIKGNSVIAFKISPNKNLRGGFKYFLFSALFGQDSHFD